ncbi:MAG TPA: CotH kinase family protein [Bacteroidia bacterium]|nr:CotH kinase family protein [Bacteroidia bacterium]
MQRRALLFFCFLQLGICTVVSAQSFYAVDTIQVIELTFTQPNWDYQLDTAKAGSDGYILAAQCIINGVAYDSVGVKFKGNSSYDSTRAKNPLHIKLDYVHGSASYDGEEDIKLGNGFSDPSLVREVLAYEILRNYMAAPQCNFARVSINGAYYGLFSNAESIDSEFNSDHFYSSNNSFFKCTPQNVVSGQVPNLLYLGTDSANYYARYEIKSNFAWSELIALCDTLANTPAVIDTILDVDRALWMLAFNNVTVNLDSYSGAFSQNYYLYMDDNGRFNPVVWDLNMCFGGFTNTGTSNLSIAGMQTMTPILHSTYGARPLIMKLLADTTYYNMYIAHMRTITDEFFANGNYLTRAQQLQTLIDSSAQADTNTFYTYTQFQQGLTTNVGTIPGVSTLMGARVTYLSGTSQFTAAAPVIANVTGFPSATALYDTVWITCTVSNADEAWLGYRDQLWKKFTRVSMYDDGLHADGVAGDGVYGAWMIGTSGLMQYYIYAQNANAGMFSPERAEYEFYSFLIALNGAGAGEVVINEFVSSNFSGATDLAGAHEDWIELHNNTAFPLTLEGLYLTDDFTNHFKFALPDVIIPANGYVIVWADEDAGNASEVHANFKLSAAGEILLLCNANGTVLDSIAYAIMAADESFGRCANGTGPFITYAAPSFNAYNTCPASIGEPAGSPGYPWGIMVYPNPAAGRLNIVKEKDDAGSFEMFSSTGQLCVSGMLLAERTTLDISSLAPGVYIIIARNEFGEIIGTERVAVSE